MATTPDANKDGLKSAMTVHSVTKPDPDPTVLTTENLRREIGNLKDLIEVRLTENAKAITLVQTATDKFRDEATLLTQQAISHLKDLMIAVMQGHVAALAGKIEKSQGETDERFRAIQTQFTLLGKATEQLDVANKTAIAAALQAQKESAGETQKTSQAAIAKSESSTSESIRTLTATFSQQFSSATDRFNDLKSRLDRGEGGRNVSDPSVAQALQSMMDKIASLQSSRDSGQGRAAVYDPALTETLKVIVAQAAANGSAISALTTSRDTTQGHKTGVDATWAIIITVIGVAVPSFGLLMFLITKLH